MTEKKIIITIDGVGGAGKGTTAKGVAKKLNYLHIDSGAMYRAVTFFLKNKNIEPTDNNEIKKYLPRIKIKFNLNDAIILNNKNIEKEIRTSEIDELVFKYAQNQLIRDFVNRQQKELAKSGGIVIDGRDMGSVVFPKAELKIYIDCDLKERARRRALQYNVIDQPEKVQKIIDDFAKRDYEDKHRKHSPLIIPTDAIIIDTTNLTTNAQIEKVYKLALEKIN